MAARSSAYMYYYDVSHAFYFKLSMNQVSFIHTLRTFTTLHELYLGFFLNRSRCYRLAIPAAEILRLLGKFPVSLFSE